MRTDVTHFRGWIFFDAECGLCTTLRHRWGQMVERLGFRLVAAQEPWAQERLGLQGKLPGEIKLLTADNRLLGGADALVHVARFVWWAWPVWLIGATSPGLALLRALYCPIARHRYAISRACGLRRAGSS